MTASARDLWVADIRTVKTIIPQPLCLLPVALVSESLGEIFRHSDRFSYLFQIAPALATIVVAVHRLVVLEGDTVDMIASVALNLDVDIKIAKISIPLHLVPVRVALVSVP